MDESLLWVFTQADGPGRRCKCGLFRIMEEIKHNVVGSQGRFCVCMCVCVSRRRRRRRRQLLKNFSRGVEAEPSTPQLPWHQLFHLLHLQESDNNVETQEHLKVEGGWTGGFGMVEEGNSVKVGRRGWG